MIGIDTIRFKIINIDKYRELEEVLYKHECVEMGHMKYVRSRNLVTTVEKIKEYKKATLTSASYDINFDINVIDKYMLFEFSLPKYWLTSNVFNFPMDPQENIYKKLVWGIKQFLLYEFKLQVPDIDLEILRVDICYNYRFKTVQNKVDYKFAIEERFNDFFPKGKTIKYENNNTIMYKTREYSFKMYDKGEEFAKHDYKKIKKRSEKEAKRIQNIADNTIRFEMTLRSAKINHIYFNNYCNLMYNPKKGRKLFKPIRRIYLDTVNLLQNLERAMLLYKDKNTWDLADRKIKEIMHRAKYRKLWAIEPTYYIKLAKKHYKDIRFRIDYIDMKVILDKYTLYNFKRYREITSPKRMFLGVGGFEKACHQNLGFPEIICFNEELFNCLVMDFVKLIKAVNPPKAKTLSSIMSIEKLSGVIRNMGYNPNAIKKYVKLKESTTSSEFSKLYHRNTQGLNNKKIRKINDWIKKNKPDSNYGIGRTNLNEVVDFKYQNYLEWSYKKNFVFQSALFFK